MAKERTVELPQGYRFAAGYAGIRKQRSDDLALMVSDQPASAAGVFTRNCVRAAPVDFSAESLRRSSGKAQLIVANAGEDGSLVIGKLLEQKSATQGFDAQNGEYVDMVKAGIIDPAKVVRTALQDAASVAGLLVTTEAMVAEKPEKKDDAAGAGMPDMGGMGM